MQATRTICATALSHSPCRPRALKGFTNGINVTGINSSFAQQRKFSRTGTFSEPMAARKLVRKVEEDASHDDEKRERPEHAGKSQS